MQVTRQKFVFIAGRKVRGQNDYGVCPHCSIKHKRTDSIFSNRGDRYCIDCAELLHMYNRAEIPTIH